MAFRIEITEPAETDTDEAYVWYHDEHPRSADRWFRGLQRAFFSLRDFPRRCTMAPEAEELGREIRHRFYGKGRHMYRILFEIRGDDTICILRVYHTSRTPLDPSDIPDS